MPVSGEVTLPSITLLIKGYRGTPPDCVVLNTNTFAISEYNNYGFNSMVKFNGKYIIADANGIYEQDSSNTDEGGYTINANVRSGEVDTYGRTVQRLRNGFLRYKSDGDIRLSTYADETTTRRYSLPLQDSTKLNERRVKFERGIKDRVFDFNIENINGSSLDFESLRITLDPITGKKG